VDQELESVQNFEFVETDAIFVVSQGSIEMVSHGGIEISFIE
jgi:hypothetical protein